MPLTASLGAKLYPQAQRLCQGQRNQSLSILAVIVLPAINLLPWVLGSHEAILLGPAVLALGGAEFWELLPNCLLRGVRD